MPPNDPSERLGLSIPYDWWPAAPMVKEIEAAGFRFAQVPSPPPLVLMSPRDATRHAAALSEALGTAGPRAGPVLARPDLRARLAIAVAAFTGMALLRTWIVLLGFELPADPAHVCLVLFTMGTIGLLPIGVGTGPTATVAALGTTNLAAATAAGMVVSAATVLAVLIYAGACWAWRPRAIVSVPA